MLRLDRQVRLTRVEKDRLRRLTDLEPAGIRTLDELQAYVDRCKARYPGRSRDTQFLHWLIDRERDRCLSA